MSDHWTDSLHGVTPFQEADGQDELATLRAQLSAANEEVERLKKDVASNERVIAALGATACHLNQRIKAADERTVGYLNMKIKVADQQSELASLRERCAGYEEMLRRAKVWTPPNGQIWKDIDATLTQKDEVERG